MIFRSLPKGNAAENNAEKTLSETKQISWLVEVVKKLDARDTFRKKQFKKYHIKILHQRIPFESDTKTNVKKRLSKKYGIGVFVLKMKSKNDPEKQLSETLQKNSVSG